MPLWKKHLRNGVLTVTILAAVFLLVLVLGSREKGGHTHA